MTIYRRSKRFGCVRSLVEPKRLCLNGTPRVFQMGGLGFKSLSQRKRGLWGVRGFSQWGFLLRWLWWLIGGPELGDVAQSEKGIHSGERGPVEGFLTGAVGMEGGVPASGRGREHLAEEGGARAAGDLMEITDAVSISLASSLPIYGCYQYWKKTSDHNINHVELEAEQATTATPLIEESLVPQHMPMKPSNIGEVHVRKTAGIWGLYLSNNLPGMVIKGQVI
ncbi:hypothetical protein R6Q59_008564 [Mikania micrantha]